MLVKACNNRKIIGPAKLFLPLFNGHFEANDGYILNFSQNFFVPEVLSPNLDSNSGRC
jgi:hypothetical protein